MNRRDLIAAALAGCFVLACAKTDEPADPVWGKEPCAHCRMIVSDKRFAAQVGGDGERRYFDDVGCMVLWLEKNGARTTRTWVREEDGRWVDAATARYEAGAKTPMDFGYAVARQGVSWDEVKERVQARAKSEGGVR